MLHLYRREERVRQCQLHWIFNANTHYERLILVLGDKGDSLRIADEHTVLI